MSPCSRKLFWVFLIASSGSAITIALVVYFLFFHWSTTARSYSISPDGMYSCEVIEKATAGQAAYDVTIRKRMGSSTSDDRWQVVREDHVSNDSVCRPYYSINWQYAPDTSTQAVEVFAPYGGSPPWTNVPSRVYQLPRGQQSPQPSTAAAGN